MIRFATALALAATAALVTPVATAAVPAPRTPSAGPSAPAAADGTVSLLDRRAFVARHHVTTAAPILLAPARAAEADSLADVDASSSGNGCLRDYESEPRDASALDISATALSHCDDASVFYALEVQTYDGWAPDRLDVVLSTLDTDVNFDTGCDGDDFFVIGYYDGTIGTAHDGLYADVVQTPTCDDNSWSYRGEASIDRVGRANFVGISWDAAQIDSPREIRYITDISDGSSYDIAPDAGSYLLSPDAPPPPPKTYPTPVARDITDTCDTQVGTPFIDTVGTTHAYSINCVSGRRITSGKTLLTFEPDGTLTKGQTATFLINMLRASGYPLPTSDGFCREDDVHADNMSVLIGVGVIPRPDDGVCGPAAMIDRELMGMWTRNALFESLVLGDAGTDWFSDDDTSAYESQINEITFTGVVTGKGNALYGPEESLTRGQMATFLARALDAIIDCPIAEPCRASAG